jgi:hypothetical protein
MPPSASHKLRESTGRRARSRSVGRRYNNTPFAAEETRPIFDYNPPGQRVATDPRQDERERKKAENELALRLQDKQTDDYVTACVGGLCIAGTLAYVIAKLTGYAGGKSIRKRKKRQQRTRRI